MRPSLPAVIQPKEQGLVPPLLTNDSESEGRKPQSRTPGLPNHLIWNAALMTVVGCLVSRRPSPHDVMTNRLLTNSPASMLILGISVGGRKVTESYKMLRNVTRLRVERISEENHALYFASLSATRSTRGLTNPFDRFAVPGGNATPPYFLSFRATYGQSSSPLAAQSPPRPASAPPPAV